MAKDPFSIRGITQRLPSMRAISDRYVKQPYIRFTQGGSSRSRGARVAATDGEVPAYSSSGSPQNEEPNG